MLYSWVACDWLPFKIYVYAIIYACTYAIWSIVKGCAFQCFIADKINLLDISPYLILGDLFDVAENPQYSRCPHDDAWWWCSSTSTGGKHSSCSMYRMSVTILLYIGYTCPLTHAHTHTHVHTHPPPHTHTQGCTRAS